MFNAFIRPGFVKFASLFAMLVVSSATHAMPCSGESASVNVVSVVEATMPAAQTKPAAPPAAQPPASPPAATQPAKPADSGAAAKLEYVQMSTSKGEVFIELNREKAPISVENFLKYVDKEFYTNTIFHRVIPSFMIQGGGFNSDMAEKPTDAPIKNEWQNGLKNVRGSIAMARTAAADSATSQFYINVVDNVGLDRVGGGGAAYAVFARVVAGMSVVDAIKGVPTANKGMHQNVPTEAVMIKSVKRITADDAAKAMAGEKK